MSEFYVIDRKYIPPRLPITPGLVLWLMFDRLHASDWVLGVSWTLYGLWFGAVLYTLLVVKRRHPSDLPKR